MYVMRASTCADHTLLSDIDNSLRLIICNFTNVNTTDEQKALVTHNHMETVCQFQRLSIALERFNAMCVLGCVSQQEEVSYASWYLK